MYSNCYCMYSSEHLPVGKIDGLDFSISLWEQAHAIRQLRSARCWWLVHKILAVTKGSPGTRNTGCVLPLLSLSFFAEVTS